MNGPATISARTIKKTSEANDALPQSTMERRHSVASARSVTTTPISAVPSVPPDVRCWLTLSLLSFEAAAATATAAGPTTQRAVAKSAAAPPPTATATEHLGGGLDQIG